MGPGRLLSCTVTIGEMLQKSNQEAEIRNGGAEKGREREIESRSWILLTPFIEAREKASWDL